MLAPGTVIGGIRIDALLGKGAMGEVYRGLQLSLKRPVAVKRIAGHLLGDDEARARFAREAQCVARIQSPYVVSVHDFTELKDDNGQEHTLLVMELVDGGASLRSLLSAHPGGFDWRTASALILHAAEGLAAAAEFGVVHRDIKPDNLMVTRKGIAKLADFGLAKSVDSSAMTIAGTVMGTPLYLPPEACRGQPVDERGDLYALGCTWFHLLTGRPPFLAENTVALLRMHLDDPPPELRTLAPTVPTAVAALVHRLLAKDPSERFQSAESLIDAMRGLDGIQLPRAVPDIFGTDTATAITTVADSAGTGSSPTAATVVAGSAPTGSTAATVVASQETAATVVPLPKEPAAIAAPAEAKRRRRWLVPLIIGVVVVLIVGAIAKQRRGAGADIKKAIAAGDMGLALQRAGANLQAHPGDADAVNLVRMTVEAECQALITAERYDDAKRALDEHRQTWKWLDTGLLERDVELARAQWFAKHYREKEAVLLFKTLRDQGMDGLTVDRAMVTSLIDSNRPAEALGAALRLAEASTGALDPQVAQLLLLALEYNGPGGDFIEKVRTLLRERHPAVIDHVKPWLAVDDQEKRFNAFYILRDANQLSDAQIIRFQLETAIKYSSSYMVMREAVAWLADEIAKPNWQQRLATVTMPTFMKVVGLNSWNEHADALIAVLGDGFADAITEPALQWTKAESEQLRWNAFKLLQRAKRSDRLDINTFHAATLTTFSPLYDSAPFHAALGHFAAMHGTPQAHIAKQALTAGKQHIEDEIARYRKSQANGMELRAQTCEKRLEQLVPVLNKFSAQ